MTGDERLLSRSLLRDLGNRFWLDAADRVSDGSERPLSRDRFLQVTVRFGSKAGVHALHPAG